MKQLKIAFLLFFSTSIFSNEAINFILKNNAENIEKSLELEKENDETDILNEILREILTSPSTSLNDQDYFNGIKKLLDLGCNAFKKINYKNLPAFSEENLTNSYVLGLINCSFYNNSQQTRNPAILKEAYNLMLKSGFEHNQLININDEIETINKINNEIIKKDIKDLLSKNDREEKTFKDSHAIIFYYRDYIRALASGKLDSNLQISFIKRLISRSIPEINAESIIIKNYFLGEIAKNYRELLTHSLQTACIAKEFKKFGAFIIYKKSLSQHKKLYDKAQAKNFIDIEIVTS